MASVFGDGNMNWLFGTRVTDAILGFGGDDTLKGFGGADYLYGGDGIDTASYFDSTAGVTVDLTTGIGTGGSAEGDRLFSIENLTGSVYDDVLTGNDSANKLYGSDGSDFLDGLGGADVLDGGRGADYMSGGLGADTFFWSSISDTGVTALTCDIVTDFDFAEGDRLDVSGIDANAYAAGNQAFTFIGAAAFSGTPGEINYIHSGGNTYIQMQTGMEADIEGVICLEGILTPEASWFIL